MKIKNVGELKKYLEQFPDDLEIKVYNGIVDDWHNIDVNEQVLIREKPKYTLETINAENIRNGQPLWKKLLPNQYKIREWDFINDNLKFIFHKSPKEKNNYFFKKILLFDIILRNKRAYDRIGTIRY